MTERRCPYCLRVTKVIYPLPACEHCGASLWLLVPPAPSIEENPTP